MRFFEAAQETESRRQAQERYPSGVGMPASEARILQRGFVLTEVYSRRRSRVLHGPGDRVVGTEPDRRIERFYRLVGTSGEIQYDTDTEVRESEIRIEVDGNLEFR